jgi:hypothetical protein
VGLHELYKKYSDQVEFINVYTSEAHAIEVWDLSPTRISKLIHKYSGARVAIGIPEHKTKEDRNKMAKICKLNLLDEIPVYVDEMDNRVAETYNGWPTRIFLIGKNGRIVYNPGPGPWSFNPVYLGPEIEKYLASM